jgi:hypothetical protein
MPKKIPFLIFFVTISIYLAYLVNGLTFISMSPDSFRFISIAQNNIDNGNGIIGNLFHYFKDASSYDMNRGRHVQYLMYLLDILTNNFMPLPFANYIITIVLLINAYLISDLIKLKFAHPFKYWVPLVIALLFFTSCFSFSPIILLILYGKIIWITFVLAFFYTKKRILKIAFLIIASFCDEFGLFSVLLIIYFRSLKLVFESRLDNINYSLRLLIPICISLICLLSFYGFNAILFNHGGSSLISFASTQTKLISSTSITEIPKYLGWGLQEILLGHIENQYIDYFLGFGFIFILLFAFHKKVMVKYVLKIRRNNIKDLIELLSKDSKLQIYLFWLLIFLFINFIAIPGGGYNDVSHYSYARYSTLFIIFIYSVFELTNSKRKELLFISLIGLCAFIHVFTFINTLKFTENQNDQYIYPDQTVNKLEIAAVYTKANETRKNKIINPEFKKDTLNLEFSGTWYYSKQKNYDIKKHSHFPINGMYKVLIWPLK